MNKNDCMRGLSPLINHHEENLFHVFNLIWTDFWHIMLWFLPLASLSNLVSPLHCYQIGPFSRLLAIIPYGISKMMGREHQKEGETATYVNVVSTSIIDSRVMRNK